MKRITMHAAPRTETGKKATKALRDNGRVPVSLYGPEIPEPQALSVAFRDIQKLLDSHTAVLVDLEVEGQADPTQALLKDHAEHPVRGHVIHADFYQVTANHTLHTMVPIEITGNAAGVKAGGILERTVREIEIECLPRNLPEHIEIDVTHMEIGDTIHVGDLELPPGVTVRSAEDTTTLVQCLMPRVTAAVAEAEAAEGELPEGVEAVAVAEGGEGEESKEGESEG